MIFAGDGTDVGDSDSDRFIERCPAVVMVRATLERLLRPSGWISSPRPPRSDSTPSNSCSHNSSR